MPTSWRLLSQTAHAAIGGTVGLSGATLLRWDRSPYKALAALSVEPASSWGSQQATSGVKFPTIQYYSAW